MDSPHPTADPIVIEGNPLPPGGSFRWLERPGGIRLRIALWPGTDPAPDKGTIVIVPGRIEFIEKYFETISELRQRGFAVATLDLRGQGLSSRELGNRLKGHVQDFKYYIDDVHAFITDVVLPSLPLPLTLLGHSMGGNISLRYLHDHPETFKCAVLSAPMTGIKLPFLAPFVASWLARLAVGFGAGTFVPITTQWEPLKAAFNQNLVTRDKDRFARYLNILRAEPLLALGPPTFGWVNAAYESMAKFASPLYVEKITTPVLIVSAGNDRLIDSATHRTLAPILPAGELAEIPDSEHEILMERDDMRRTFWNAFDQFVARGVI